MLPQQQRRKTRSQLVQDNQQGSRQQLNNPYVLQHVINEEIDSGKVKQQKLPLQRKSNWNRKQRIKYLVFINYYSQLPNWGSDLKSIPTYKALSQFIKSRSPEQCKSFHLSTKRSFKSIEEMIKTFIEELQHEEGYHRLLDRYQFQIMSFQIEHKLLQPSQLEEKPYFKNKLTQKCKENGIDNSNPANKQYQSAINSHGSNPNISGESPNIALENQSNLKININYISKEKEKEKQKEKQKEKEKEKSKHMEAQKEKEEIRNFGKEERLAATQKEIEKERERERQNLYPFYGMPPYALIRKDENYLKPSPQTNIIPGNSPFMMPNPMTGMNFFLPNQSFPPMDRNIQKPSSTQVIKQPTLKPQPFLPQRRVQNPTSIPPNDRMLMQQNLNRMIQANKKMYAPFQSYGPYQANPFNPMNPMHINPQFRNQMQFNLPPPGGFAYMLNGFDDPYNVAAINPMKGNRFGPSLVPQHQQIDDKRVSKERQAMNQNTSQEKIRQTNSKQNIITEQESPSQLSQARKKLILQCHEHWVNWLRAVTELNRRKQAMQNVVVNNL